MAPSDFHPQSVLSHHCVIISTLIFLFELYYRFHCTFFLHALLRLSFMWLPYLHHSITYLNPLSFIFQLFTFILLIFYYSRPQYMHIHCHLTASLPVLCPLHCFCFLSSHILSVLVALGMGLTNMFHIRLNTISDLYSVLLSFMNQWINFPLLDKQSWKTCKARKSLIMK